MQSKFELLAPRQTFPCFQNFNPTSGSPDVTKGGVTTQVAEENIFKPKDYFSVSSLFIVVGHCLVVVLSHNWCTKDVWCGDNDLLKTSRWTLFCCFVGVAVSSSLSFWSCEAGADSSSHFLHRREEAQNREATGLVHTALCNCMSGAVFVELSMQLEQQEHKCVCKTVQRHCW